MSETRHAPVLLVRRRGAAAARAERGSSRARGSTRAAAETVAEPGSFVTTDAAGIPVLVTRDERRSAARVPQRLPPSRRRARRGLRAEELDPVPLPRLDVRPRRRAAGCAARGTRARLRPERVVAAARERRHVGAVSLRQPRSAGAPPLAEHLGELPAILARDLDLDGLVFHSRVEFGANANWKVVAENFLECYHCATAHPALQRRGGRSPRPLRARGAPDVRRPVLPRAKETDEHGQFHLLYPNTGINVFPGPANLSIGPILPNGPAPNRAPPRLLLRRRTSTRLAARLLRVRRPGRPRGPLRSSSRCSAAGLGHARPRAAAAGARSRLLSRVPGLDCRDDCSSWTARARTRKRLAVELEAAPELLDHEARDERPEILLLLAGNDRRSTVAHGRQLEAPARRRAR